MIELLSIFIVCFLIGLTPGIIIYIDGARNGSGCGGWGWNWLWKKETYEEAIERMKKNGCI